MLTTAPWHSNRRLYLARKISEMLIGDVISNIQDGVDIRRSDTRFNVFLHNKRKLSVSVNRQRRELGIKEVVDWLLAREQDDEMTKNLIDNSVSERAIECLGFINKSGSVRVAKVKENFRTNIITALSFRELVLLKGETITISQKGKDLLNQIEAEKPGQNGNIQEAHVPISISSNNRMQGELTLKVNIDAEDCKVIYPQLAELLKGLSAVGINNPDIAAELTIKIAG